jgi:hypothetical protein
MNALSYIIITVIVVVAAIGIGRLVITARKNGASIPWDKINPIVEKVIVQAIAFKQANAQGTYQAVEDFTISILEVQINAATFLTAEEKAMLTPDLIRSIIGPKLKALYDTKV